MAREDAEKPSSSIFQHQCPKKGGQHKASDQRTQVPHNTFYCLSSLLTTGSMFQAPYKPWQATLQSLG